MQYLVVHRVVFASKGVVSILGTCPSPVSYKAEARPMADMF